MGLLVNEIFYSIQGESLFAGLPCVFIRLMGCNLRCSYCDTQYAYHNGRVMEMEAILQEVFRFQCPLVEITGGEPLIQKQTPALIQRLIQQGYTVLLETNGSMDIGGVDPRCVRIVDVKCPGSGESHRNNGAILRHLTGHDQVKFVLTNRNDYEFAKQWIASAWDSHPPVPILFSPAHPYLDPSVLAEWILQDQINVRLHLQLHKLIWPDSHKGR